MLNVCTLSFAACLPVRWQRRELYLVRVEARLRRVEVQKAVQRLSAQRLVVARMQATEHPRQGVQPLKIRVLERME